VAQKTTILATQKVEEAIKKKYTGNIVFRLALNCGEGYVGKKGYGAIWKEDFMKLRYKKKIDK